MAWNELRFYLFIYILLCSCTFLYVSLGLKEASQLLESLQPKLLLSPVALYFKGLLFRCKVNDVRLLYSSLCASALCW